MKHLTGLNAQTGQLLGGLDHLAQSITDILTTPLGSRVIRREYGSILPLLIDQPLNESLFIRVYAATALALMRWEPRIRLTQVSCAYIQPAGLAVTITYQDAELQTSASQLTVIVGASGGHS